MNLLDNRQEILDSVDTFDFNVFNVSREIGRENTFPSVVFRCMEDLPLDDSQTTLINNDKLICFLNEISKGYRRDVEYHNDLHGADVTQMMYLFFKHGNLH